MSSKYTFRIIALYDDSVQFTIGDIVKLYAFEYDIPAKEIISTLRSMVDINTRHLSPSLTSWSDYSLFEFVMSRDRQGFVTSDQMDQLEKWVPELYDSICKSRAYNEEDLTRYF